MNRIRRVVIGGILPALLACATPGAKPRGAEPFSPQAAGCPQSLEDVSWLTLQPACQGAVALAMAREASARRDWAAQVMWSERALDTLPSGERPHALFYLAEGRYAQGETVATTTDLDAALALGLPAETAGRAHYYLAEMALARGDAAGALPHLAEALLRGGEAEWRPAAESLLGMMLRAEQMPLESTELPPSLGVLSTFIRAERAFREQRYDEARALFVKLAEAPEAGRLGLRNKIDARIEDLRSADRSQPGRVGLVLPFSGRAAPLGWFVVRGALLSLNPFADPTLELVIENDFGEPYRAARAMRALHGRGATAIIGPLVGKNAMVGVESAARLNLPTVVLSSVDLPALAPWAVREAITPIQQAHALLNESMGRRGFKRFAILYPDEPFGRAMKNAFWDAVVARGGQITAVQEYEPGATTFRKPIRALAGADEFTPEEVTQRRALNQPIAHLDFDAVFIPDGARTAGLIIPQLLYFDVRGPVFMGPSTWNDPRLVELGRGYVDGSIFVDWYVPDAPGGFAQSFLEQYEAAYGEKKPPSVTAQAYEAGFILRDAVRLGDRRAVRDALYAKTWSGFSGPARVGKEGEIHRPFYVLTVKGRRIVPLGEITFE